MNYFLNLTHAEKNINSYVLPWLVK